MSMANRLHHLRKKHHLSQEQVAELAGTTRQTVSQWENEKAVPSLETLNILARHYGVTLDYLVNGVEPAPAGPHSPEEAIPKKSVGQTVLPILCAAVCLAVLVIVIVGQQKSDQPQSTGHSIIVSQEDMDTKEPELNPDLGFDLTWPDE